MGKFIKVLFLAILWVFVVFLITYPTFTYNLITFNPILDDINRIRELGKSNIFERRDWFIAFLVAVDFIISYFLNKPEDRKSKNQIVWTFLFIFSLIPLDIIFYELDSNISFMLIIIASLLVKISSIADFIEIKKLPKRSNFSINDFDNLIAENSINDIDINEKVTFRNLFWSQFIPQNLIGFKNKKYDFIGNIVGNSMNPVGLKNGDIVVGKCIVDPKNENFKKGDILVLKINSPTSPAYGKMKIRQFSQMLENDRIQLFSYRGGNGEPVLSVPHKINDVVAKIYGKKKTQPLFKKPYPLIS